MNRRGSLVWAVAAGLGAVVAGCQQPCDSDLGCGAAQACNPITRRCEDKSQPGPSSCSADGDCQGGRACVDGTCAFAAPCLYLGGSWQVVDGRDGGSLGTVEASQSGCALDFPGHTGGPRPIDLATEGTVDRLGAVSGLQVKLRGAGGSTLVVNCDGQFGGNETLALRCNPDGVGPLFHLYARPGAGLAPQTCNPGDRTACAALGTACETNLAGVPACGL